MNNAVLSADINPDYLRDESRRTGSADQMWLPTCEDDVREILRRAHAEAIPVTVQGARTGIAGGAVPRGGWLISLTRFNGITGMRELDDGGLSMTVQPGVLLDELSTALSRSAIEGEDDWSAPAAAALNRLRNEPRRFFAPDPTETSASLGGMAACNASGARTLAYGPMRQHILALRVVLADGDVLALRRGEHRSTGRAFELITESGRRLAGTLPEYRMPAVKNAAGLFAADDMDLVDLFIGSEGTLGVISELELDIRPWPRACWGVMCFLPSEEAAVGLVEYARSAPHAPVALEYFDPGLLELLRRRREAGQEVPELAPAWRAALYLEYHGDSEEQVEEAVMAMSEQMLELGGDEEATWLASDTQDMERLKTFRHLAPESVNLTIDQRRKSEPSLTKLGTDLAVPDGRLRDVLALYRGDLDAAGLEYVIFGHIGNNHLHVNILPRTLDDFERGKALYHDWARRVVDWGGSVAAEHGIGKLKTGLLEIMYGPDGIEAMRAVKRVFDPQGLLNPGNCFVC